MSEIVLTLPDSVAEEAEANGLLKPEAITAMLRAEIRRRRVNKLFAASDKLVDSDETLTEAEIEAEIAATRKEKSSSDANGS
jgi:hypothetical protein